MKTEVEAKKPVFDAGKKTIILDPGHGGANNGAQGPGGILEKRVTLTRLTNAAEEKALRDTKVLSDFAKRIGKRIEVFFTSLTNNRVYGLAQIKKA